MRTSPLELHCWGGLGSQLFALSYFLELKNQRLDREIVLVFHTSGVTLRRCEVREILESSGIPFREVDDFGLGFLTLYTRKLFSLYSLIRRRSFREPGSFAISKIGKAAQLRGHYSSRVHSTTNIGLLADFLSLSRETNKVVERSVHLHMRIGDLEFLESKAPLKVERIVKAMELLSKEMFSFNFVIHSDSSEKATNELRKYFPSLKFLTGNSSALDVILQQLTSGVFIATPSKISEWAVCLRLYRDPKKATFAPREMQFDLLNKFPFLNTCPGLEFY